MTDAERAKRDKAIITAFREGKSYAELARDFGLVSVRTRSIVHREAGRLLRLEGLSSNIPGKCDPSDLRRRLSELKRH